jgi:tetratricopeptide (TPR) repeat protein
LDLADGRPSDAVAKFDKALAIDAANSVGNSYYAAKAHRERNYPEAINLARKALVSDPDSMDAYAVLAGTYLEMGLTDVGVLVGRNALGLSPSDGPIQNLLGLTFLKTGEVRQAVQLFQKATRDDPRLFDARMNFGAVTLGYKDAATAVEQFGEAVRLRPASVEARLGQAVALRGLNKGEDAQRVLVDLARDPNFADARFNLCLTYQENLNRLDQALTECDAFLRLAPTSHPKRKEATRRLESLRLEIEAARSTTPMPAPAAPVPAPSADGGKAGSGK